MQIGYKLPNCAGVLCEPEWATPANLHDLSDLAARLGYDSLWFHDHLLAPKEVNIPTPDFYEALVTISHLATRLPQMTFGVATLIVPLRDPVLLARQLTTLNAFFPGRVILGVGVGRYETEFEACGSNRFHQRGRAANEALQLIRALWDQDEVTFEGEFFAARQARHFPKHPGKTLPIWVGGNAAASIQRAAAYGDGYLPAAKHPTELRQDREQLDRELERVGRDPASFPMGLSLTVDLRAPGEGLSEDLEERGMHGHAGSRVVTGTAPEVTGKLNEIAAAGVEHFALSFRAHSLAQLKERMESFACDVRPSLAVA
jgi:probable F420-dependent oxidoreductase